MLQLDSMPIDLVINDRHLASTDLYQIFATGRFLKSKADARDEINSLSGMPVVMSLLESMFYAHSGSAVRVVAAINDAIDSIRDSQHYRHEYTVKPVGRCIYCLADSSSATSREHAYPEGLGNDVWLLPRGAVCDTCNHRLSALDSALVDFPTIAFLRVLYVPYTKKGKFPKAVFQGMTVEKTEPTHIRITDSEFVPPAQDPDVNGDGLVHIPISMTSRGKLDHLKLGQAVLKLGLSMVVLDRGYDLAVSSRYDLVREFVSGKIKRFPNYLLVVKRGKPHGEVKRALGSWSGTW